MSSTGDANEVFHKFLTIHRFLRQTARKVSKQGIRPRGLSALRFLRESGSATVGEVQAYLYQSPSTVSALIAKLEEKGYVTRTRSVEDNRVVIVQLTPAGDDLVQRTPITGLSLLRRRLAALPPERLAAIDDSLAEIMTLMEVTDSQ